MPIALLLFSSLSWVLLSCDKEPNNMQVEIDKTYKDVDSELWKYFYNFEKEAEKRGLAVDLNDADIVGLIEKLNLNGPVGLCNYNVHGPDEVVIDEPFWEIASESRKELIVFHELGHCYLKRPHREDVSSDGSCISIMRSGADGCIDNYNSYTREEYLNELFFEN